VRCIADSSLPPLREQGVGADVPAPPPLRGFQLRDVPFIASIVADALHEQYDNSLYASLSDAWPDGFLVAPDPVGRPVGFLLGVCQVEGEGRVLMFAVDREHRRVGVGAALMSEFLRRARSRGLRKATLEVRVGNATAIRFYTRFGYSVVDLLRGYYSDGENGYQMARELT
jgi:[ribosomal protein S18]-alanine N-acetyltransferase